MSKHTLGPWFAVQFGPYWMVLDEPYYEGDSLMDSDKVGDETAEANAKLAATAPELLEALQELYRYCASRKNFLTKKGASVIHKAEVAIQNATL